MTTENRKHALQRVINVYFDWTPGCKSVRQVPASNDVLGMSRTLLAVALSGRLVYIVMSMAADTNGRRQVVRNVQFN